jgi:hypothetical protein
METAKYTAEKDKVMKAATENFLNDLRSKLEAMNYKYCNNTRLFNSEIEYLMFCRQQIRATTLKMIAFDIELEASC